MTHSDAYLSLLYVLNLVNSLQAHFCHIHKLKLLSSIASTVPYNSLQNMKDNNIITVMLNGHDRFTENINVKIFTFTQYYIKNTERF